MIETPEEVGARLAGELLREGIARRASDIHVDPHPEGLRVRYRIDGVLFEGPRISRPNRYAVITRLKQMAGLDTAARRQIQEGRVAFSTEDADYDLVVTVVPFVEGEKVVLKVLSRSVDLDLSHLADPTDRAKLEALLSRTHGLLLVTGPVDSGKAVTLMAMAQYLGARGLSVASVEESALLRLPGVHQAEVNDDAGLSFQALIRAILKQDVDAILIGEVRDNDIAVMAAEAALEGRLVLAALHTDDAPSAVARLVDIGLPAFMAASALIGVCSQRMVRAICPHCKQPSIPSPSSLEALGLSVGSAKTQTFYAGRGCERCSETGYLGRIALREVLENTEELRQLIVRGASTHALRHVAIEQGMETFRDAAARQALAGAISVEEGARAAFQVRETLAQDTVGLLRGRVGELEAQARDLEERVAAQEAERKRIRAELEVAHRMQMGMMPSGDPRVPGYDVAAVCRPAEEVGGDYYDYVELDERRMGFVIGDATGKGIPAALLMSTVKTFLVAQAPSAHSPSDLVRQLNEMVCAMANRPGPMTFFYSELEKESGVLRYCNAGHHFPYLLTNSGCVYLEESAFPLGASREEEDYGDSSVVLAPGEVLVLYSDGVVEARDPSNALYGYDAFERSLVRLHGRPAKEMVEGLLEDLVAFTGGRPPEDDITLVVVRRV